mgnify:CR=1 FL=1
MSSHKDGKISALYKRREELRIRGDDTTIAERDSLDDQIAEIVPETINDMIALQSLINCYLRPECEPTIVGRAAINMLIGLQQAASRA